jgi:protein-tyrosine phosphatase
LAACSLLFLVVYGGCNWVTAHRHDVGMWYYDWELRIPFVPAMIVPYWSIDLLFVGAFFVCGERRELDTLGRRIALAILAAGVCFLLMPLRIGFPRPQVDGVFGWMFGALRTFDQPFNLVPSLHIALRTILADLYARHTQGGWRVAVHVWFSLVGFSTVLTYQHHVVDVVGGFVLAAACFYLVRGTPWRWPVQPNHRVGAYYAAGSVAAGIIGGLMWWPAVAMGLVALAYFGLGPGVYRKENGALPLSAKLVLGPVLLGQQLSLLYYRRQCRAWDEVAPNVLIGRVLNDAEAAAAGAVAVLDLTAEFSEACPFRTVAYQNMPILDLTAPSVEQLREAVAFICEHSAKGRVYVHCKIGYSRSAAVVGAYLLASGQAQTIEDAVSILRQARPVIVMRPEVFIALQQFRCMADCRKEL